MGKSIRLKKGYDIKLTGEAQKEILDAPASEIFAVKPTDFRSVTPKLQVKVGDEVMVGDALFFDKQNEEIRFGSPVSGEVVEIVRGAKRRILEIRILPDKTQKFSKVDIPSSIDAASVKETLLKANLWFLIRQRPFNITANPADEPTGIFVSLFDTAPLAPDLGFVAEQNKEALHKGLEVLNALSGGKLYLGKPSDSDFSFSAAEVNSFSGPHPAGNVGIQMHHTHPLKPGEKAWYLDLADVITVGHLFTDGRFNPERIIAITGSEVISPKYYKLKLGQSLKSLFSENVNDRDVRLIQGNVLTGATSHNEDFLSFFVSQLTAIPEGAHSEFLGWLLPSTSKLSLSRTFFSWLMPNKKYDLDTNLHGEERAFVVSGQYEKVLPMNIMPVQLLKAILAKDIERMEALGIHEISEEDMALCEFVCTSKINVQEIVREGLDMMMAEG